MLALEAGLAQILAALPTLPTEIIPLSEADGRVAAAEVTAGTDLPPFDNSSMDGYAVRAADTHGGKPLRLAGHVAAGEWPASALAAGECIRLFTGSPLPPGADAVVMQEDTRPVTGNRAAIEILDPVKPWENVRFRGEDVRTGTTLVRAGGRLGPPQIGLLAATGTTEVTVARRPMVAILTNGSELRPPGSPLSPGQIYESNAPMLAALLRRVGADTTCLPPPPDDPRIVGQSLSAALDSADVVLTVGGASVGEHDLIRDCFTSLGGELSFWRLALKPGKPFFVGRHQGRLLFGLPGNPVSAFVTAVLLVLPALRRMQGETDLTPTTVTGILAEPLSNPDRRRHFVRVRVGPDGQVRPAGPQASHRLASLAMANGLVDVPPGTDFEAGRVVPVIGW